MHDNELRKDYTFQHDDVAVYTVRIALLEYLREFYDVRLIHMRT